MLPILTPYFTGPFLPYAQGVALVPPTQYKTLSDIMDNHDLIIEIQNFAIKHQVTKPRAQASIWHMHYTLRILPSILACQTLLSRSLPLKLTDVYWDKNLQQLQIPHQGELHIQAETSKRYHELVFNHLAPLHIWLEEHFSINPKVLWSNAAFRINYFLSTIETAIGSTPQLKDDKLNLLKQPKISFEQNPLYKKPILLNGDNGVYQLRNECCLLHEVPVKNHCSDCPKLSHHVTYRSLNIR